MNEAMENPVGHVLDARYQVTRKIAEGGMATVYEATDVRLGRTVAIKIMHTQLAQGPHRDQFVQRFQREARSAAAIANPHIVQIYDTGEFEGLDYLVMEYVHGVNLRYEMSQQGVFTVRETLRIVGEVLDGLSAAHAVGVVHRDIKPENILLNDRGRVQITDFGLAKAASQATLATTGMLLGTAAYLAPEMIENNQALPQGDLYSVGIMAWEMLTGEVPFASDNPVTMVFKHVHEDIPPLTANRPSMPKAISDFVAHLTARQVAERPTDAAAALRELHALTTTLSPSELAYRIRGNGETATSVLPSDMASTTDSGMGEVPTQASPDETETQIVDATAADGETMTHQARQGNLRRIAIVSGAALLLAAMIGGGYAWWYFLGPGSYWTVPSADDVSCETEQNCSLKGADFTKYERALKVAGIPYTTTEQYSDDVAKGSVISSDPANVGDHVSKRNGTTMTIVVSKGVREATIPDDITDASSDNGKTPLATLQQLGFDNVTHDKERDQYSLDVPEGALLSIDPQPGTTLRHGDPITVTLSKGPMPVSMPNIVGESKEDALSSLNDAKLKVTTSEMYSDTVESGTVISASVKAGTQMHWGDAVNIVVSKGPEMVTIPDVRGKSESEAKQTLEALGLKVEITAPLGDLTQTVRLQDPAPGQQVRLRDTKGNATTVTLTVV
ncbi:protein kinase domain-containing protein [Bifidobacterium tissieri]|uniref:non-specific serine/threonine protein kinase n=1 Tax=Bifidobacterium tissieri TaxID=1630162 RepID=A0A5M9ZY27_9BIFI|nr:PASTA domain-containing protein [Bifidobacterium tissieri]KAA8831567.1 serine/threonine-protein kinase [Bifidobacterium tissieri]KAA8832534.1 serine/threonine-protein kinase [Bifidobacterium tissieri]